MKSAKGLCLLLVLSLSAGIVFADESNGSAETRNVEVITVERAVELAMINNIQLASSAIDVRIKKRAKDLAWNVLLPGVQVTGTLARSNNVTKYEEPEPSEQDHWNVMAGLEISLNLNLALVEGMKDTRQNYEAGLITYEQAQQDTEINVRKAFYGILLQKGNLSVARDKLATSIERLEQTRINYRNGLVSELTYLQMQLAVETQRPSIMETELELEQQKNLFAFLIGLPIGTKIILDGEINPSMEEFNADELVREHLGNRLDFAAMEKKRELLETQLRATQIQRFTPSLGLKQSFAPRLSAIDDSWTNTGNWNDSSGAFSITILFNITDMLPFSAKGVEAAETRDSLDKITLGFNQLVYNAELEIRDLVKKLDKSKASISAMDLNVAMAEKAYRLTEQAYRAGTVEYLDLKDAETTLVEARLGVLAEKYKYLSALLDLEKALNTKF